MHLAHPKQPAIFATDALSCKEEHKPNQPDKTVPVTLFDPEWFLEIALLALLDQMPTILETGKPCYTLTDEQLLEQIHKHTSCMDPLNWPKGYKLNAKLVLVSKDTGWIWVPLNEDLQHEVFATHHDGKIAGHLGMAGTLELVSQKYWWMDLINFTRRYVQGCHTCAHNKIQNQLPTGLLWLLPSPEGPWLWTQSDFITQLPPSQGFNAIYVITDQLTKMAHFIPCKSTCMAEQLVELHVQWVWPLHGLPLYHNTDHGPQFAAPYMQNLYKSLGIDQRLSTAYHPEMQGQVELNNKWLVLEYKSTITYWLGNLVVKCPSPTVRNLSANILCILAGRLG